MTNLSTLKAWPVALSLVDMIWGTVPTGVASAGGYDVWHLGDFMSAKAGDCAKLLAVLTSRKHLIVGDNDPETTTSSAGWASVQHYAELREDGPHLVLCYYAFRTWNQMGKGSINLHGHSHGRLKPIPLQFDVGADARGLRPVSRCARS